MTNTIRKLVLPLVIILLCSVNTIAQESIEKEAFVIKIDNLSEEKNVEIFRHFFRHDSFKAINTCQELGLIVFQIQEGTELGAMGAAHSVQTILKNQFNVESAEWLSNYSQNQVNIDCRTKKRELISQ